MAEIARELLHVNLEDEMRQSYLDYAMSVIVGRALPDVRDGLKPVHRRVLLRDARARQRLEQGLQEVRPRRRRRDRQVPPARRHGGLRHDRAHGAAVLDALPAGRRPGQLRLGRRRRPGGHALHRSAHVARSPRELLADIDKETVDFVPNYDESETRAVGAADARPEPAGQRLLRHRGRHGDQHPAAQPERDHRRLRRAASTTRRSRSPS